MVVREPVLPSSMRIASMEGFWARARSAWRARSTSERVMPPRAMGVSYDFVLWYVVCIYVLFVYVKQGMNRAILTGDKGRLCGVMASAAYQTAVPGTKPAKLSDTTGARIPREYD